MKSSFKIKADLKPRCGCPFCTDDDHCNVWADPLTDEWYLEIPSGQFDPVDNFEPIMVRTYIAYCPYCGKELS